MSLQSTQHWKISSLQYAEQGTNKIFADTAHIYKGCGVALYKNEQLISFIELKVVDVITIEEKNGLSNYYAKGEEGYGMPLYLYVNSSKNPFKDVEGLFIPRIMEITDKNGVTHKEDASFILSQLSIYTPDTYVQRIEEIFNSEGWNMTENYNGLVVKGEKNGEKSFFLSKDIYTKEDIYIAAEHWKEIQKPKSSRS